MYHYQSQTGNKWLFLCEPAQVSLPWENCSFESKGDGASLFPPLHAVPGFNPVFMFHFCFLPLRQSLALSFKVTLTWCASAPPPMLGLQLHTILYYYSGLKIFVTVWISLPNKAEGPLLWISLKHSELPGRFFFPPPNPLWFYSSQLLKKGHFC